VRIVTSLNVAYSELSRAQRRVLWGLSGVLAATCITLQWTLPPLEAFVGIAGSVLALVAVGGLVDLIRLAYRAIRGRSNPVTKVVK
jgi:hypothetical protein